MNKRITYLLFLILFLIQPVASYSGNFTPLDIKTAEKMWGKGKFNAKAFKAGDYKVRSAMAVDIIASKYYVEHPLADVKNDLGRQDGYFENDAVPAYILTAKNSNPVWQLVFIPDEKWEKVKRVEIQKN